jgi:hypothetical protein
MSVLKTEYIKSKFLNFNFFKKTVKIQKIMQTQKIYYLDFLSFTIFLEFLKK